MAKKGIDSTFIHTGIRKEDMRLIEAICMQEEIDFDWLSEQVLKAYHEQKVRNLEVDDSAIEKIISMALQKIK